MNASRKKIEGNHRDLAEKMLDECLPTKPPLSDRRAVNSVKEFRRRDGRERDFQVAFRMENRL